MTIDDHKTPVRPDDEIPVAELSDGELALVQGGAAFSPEELTEVKGIIDEASKHHGVNLSSAFIQGGLGTVVSFGANAAGQFAGEKVHKGKH